MQSDHFRKDMAAVLCRTAVCSKSMISYGGEENNDNITPQDALTRY